MSGIDRDALSKLIQRFAISALSRERKDEALNEEILVGKHTGEFYIKTKDGVVVSTDIMDRVNSSTNNAIRIAEMVGMTGHLFKVEFDDLQLPNHIDYSINMLNMEPIQIPNDTNSILLYLDIDGYVVKEDRAVKSVFDNNVVNITISCLFTDGSMNTMEFATDLRSINYTKLQLDALKVEGKDIDSIFITNINVVGGVPFLTQGNNDEQILMLHNIFVTVDR